MSINQILYGEAWYRDFEREISVLNLIREICTKHKCPADANEMDDKKLDEMLVENLEYGTDRSGGYAVDGLSKVKEYDNE